MTMRDPAAVAWRRPLAAVVAAALVMMALGHAATRPRCEVVYHVYAPAASPLFDEGGWKPLAERARNLIGRESPLTFQVASDPTAGFSISYTGDRAEVAASVRATAYQLAAELRPAPMADAELADRLYRLQLRIADAEHQEQSASAASGSEIAGLRAEEAVLVAEQQSRRRGAPGAPPRLTVARVRSVDRGGVIARYAGPVVLLGVLAAAMVRLMLRDRPATSHYPDGSPKPLALPAAGNRGQGRLAA